MILITQLRMQNCNNFDSIDMLLPLCQLRGHFGFWSGLTKWKIMASISPERRSLINILEAWLQFSPSLWIHIGQKVLRTHQNSFYRFSAFYPTVVLGLIIRVVESGIEKIPNLARVGSWWWAAAVSSGFYVREVVFTMINFGSGLKHSFAFLILDFV